MKLVGCAVLSLVSMFAAAGCGGDDGDDFTPVAENYAANVYANYSDTVTKAEALKTAVDAFVATPEPGDARRRAARRGSTRASRTSRPRPTASTTARSTTPRTVPKAEINSWPLDEDYIDYVEGDADAGIINDPTDVSDDHGRRDQGAERERRRDEHLHRLSRDRVPALGPGPQRRPARATRPYTDYVDATGTAANQDRRAHVPAARRPQLLVDDLTQVATRGRPTRRTTARSSWPDRQGRRCSKILLGMGSLSGAELSGERMTVALDNQRSGGRALLLQRQHAPRHLIGNAIGIQNVYLGTYGDERRRGHRGPRRARRIPTLADKLEDADRGERRRRSQAIPAPVRSGDHGRRASRDARHDRDRRPSRRRPRRPSKRRLRSASRSTSK